MNVAAPRSATPVADTHGRTTASTVVFDLGGVLIDWDPRHVLDDAAIAALDIDGAQRELDRGTPVAEVHARWRATYPAQVALVDRYFGDWHRTIAGPIDETVAVLAELREAASVRLYALSNFSGELFRQIRPRFAFLGWFDGLLISGDEGVIKPDAKIYQLLVDRFGLTPSQTVFIDDRLDNVAGARTAGLVAVHYRSAVELRRELRGLGLL